MLDLRSSLSRLAPCFHRFSGCSFSSECCRSDQSGRKNKAGKGGEDGVRNEIFEPFRHSPLVVFGIPCFYIENNMLLFSDKSAAGFRAKLVLLIVTVSIAIGLIALVLELVRYSTVLILKCQRGGFELLNPFVWR